MFKNRFKLLMSTPDKGCKCGVTTYLIKVGVPNPFQAAGPARDDIVPVSPLAQAISFHGDDLWDVVWYYASASRINGILAAVGFAFALTENCWLLLKGEHWNGHAHGSPVIVYGVPTRKT